jgi:ADP-ribose pyrophosphatase YjhB (NUDIX family)
VTVAALVVDDERLLLVRRGTGPAGGVWDLPQAVLASGQTVLEAVVAAAADEAGIEAAGGDLVEILEQVDEDPHVIRLVCRALLPADAVPSAGATVADARWFDAGALGDLRFAPGVAEFLHDHGALDIIT